MVDILTLVVKVNVLHHPVRPLCNATGESSQKCFWDDLELTVSDDLLGFPQNVWETFLDFTVPQVTTRDINIESVSWNSSTSNGV